MQMKNDLQIWGGTIKKCQIIDMATMQYFELMSKNIVNNCFIDEIFVTTLTFKFSAVL